MAQDALLTLADDQTVASGWDATGYMLSEHSINLGATQDPFNGVQMFAVFTVKTSFTATNATDTLQILIKTAAGKSFTGGAAVQSILPTIGHSSRFVAADLLKGKQIVIALSPETAQAMTGIGATKPEGQPVVYGYLIGQDAALAPISFTGGVFDLEIRAENVRGQKYYPQATSVG
jgi:hypothetical protein